MIVELAISYVAALNGGQVPTIESAWDSVQASELERAVKESIQLYERSLHEHFLSHLPMVETAQEATLSKIREQAIAHFQGGSVSSTTQRDSRMLEALIRLKRELKTKREGAVKRNLELTRTQCVQALEACIG